MGSFRLILLGLLVAVIQGCCYSRPSHQCSNASKNTAALEGEINSDIDPYTEDSIVILEALIAHIAELREQGDIDGALSLSYSTENRFGSDPLLLCQRSSILESLGRLDEAEVDGRKTIDLWPAGYVYMSRFYTRHGDNIKANQMITRGLRDSRVLDDKQLQAQLHFLKAKHLVEKDDLNEALAECQIAIGLVPAVKVTLLGELKKLRMTISQRLEEKDE